MQGDIGTKSEGIPPIDHKSGTFHNTQVSARKDGPRARIAYSVHYTRRHTTGSRCVVAL